MLKRSNVGEVDSMVILECTNVQVIYQYTSKSIQRYLHRYNYHNGVCTL